MDRLEATSSCEQSFSSASANVLVHCVAKKTTAVDRLPKQHVLLRWYSVAIVLNLVDAKPRAGCTCPTGHAETIGSLDQTMEKIFPHHSDAA